MSVVLKKTEDSEWSRFSRVLTGQPRAAEDSTEQPAEPVATARETAAVAPAPAPAPVRPAAAFSRSQPGTGHEMEEVETVIGLHSFFDGTFKCESSMRIKGTVQGEIACAKSLVVEETAKVNAKVVAANAIIAGQVEGSITCDGRLEVLATGKIAGELTAGVLIIQEGAFFEGHLKMKERKAGPPPADEAAVSVRKFGSGASEPVVS